MITYVLILTFCTGTLSHDDSIALVTQEFSSQQRCEDAGRAATKFDTMVKNTKYVCVPK